MVARFAVSMWINWWYKLDNRKRWPANWFVQLDLVTASNAPIQSSRWPHFVISATEMRFNLSKNSRELYERNYSTCMNVWDAQVNRKHRSEHRRKHHWTFNPYWIIKYEFSHQFLMKLFPIGRYSSHSGDNTAARTACRNKRVQSIPFIVRRIPFYSIYNYKCEYSSIWLISIIYCIRFFRGVCARMHFDGLQSSSI